MSTLLPLALIYAVWFAWGLSWEVAALWSSRTQAKLAGVRSFFRVFTTAGFLLVLLTPPLAWKAEKWTNLFARRPLNSLTASLWSTSEVAGWLLVCLAAAGFLLCWWARIHLGKLG